MNSYLFKYDFHDAKKRSVKEAVIVASTLVEAEDKIRELLGDDVWLISVTKNY